MITQTISFTLANHHILTLWWSPSSCPSHSQCAHKDGVNTNGSALGMLRLRNNSYKQNSGHNTVVQVLMIWPTVVILGV